MQSSERGRVLSTIAPLPLLRKASDELGRFASKDKLAAHAVKASAWERGGMEKWKQPAKEKLSGGLI